MKKRVWIFLTAIALFAFAIFYTRTASIPGPMPSQASLGIVASNHTDHDPGLAERTLGEDRLEDWASASSEQIDRDFHDTRNRAESGDPVAQRQLAEMYERCFLHNLSPDNFTSTMKMYAEADKANASRYYATGKRFSHYCNSIDSGKMIPLVAPQLWYAEAAKRGDLLAQIKVASAPDSQTDEATYRSLVARAFESKNPDAIFAIGDMLSMAKTSVDLGNYRQEAGGEYADFAWEIAACRAGKNCGTGSFRMDAACLNGLCNASNLEAAIKNTYVPQAQLKFLEKDVERIRRLLDRAPK
ncbi:hypothetical protein ACDH70_18445 [Xanthomonas axonopodis pv. poinsettiicola]|uniref:hypothetical protein n=1 Tax=Xanthomonas TaxID=338 RepID=UPI001E2D2019|nr:hypothetical protein [Xanthomonas codiaei]MCC8537324.1 hypothetical protein [Xanthomonas codiaei]